MSESSKHIDLFTKSGCLTKESLQRYHSGELSDFDKAEINKHLDDCELCTDALEGYLLISDPNRIDSIVTEINENIKNTVEAQSKSLNIQTRFYYYVAAASVIILIGVFSYFSFYLQNSSSEIATLDEKSLSEQTEMIHKSDEQVKEEVFVEDDMKASKPATLPKSNVEKNDILPVEVVESELEIAMDETDPADNEKGTIEETMQEVMITEPASIAINDEPTQYMVSEEAVRAEGMAAGQVLSYEDQPDSEMQISSKSSAAAKKGGQKASMESKGNSITIPDSLSDSTITIFTAVENNPEFPGGEKGMLKHIQENISYPDSAKLLGIQGTVFISFVVKRSGKVNNAKIVRGIGGGCDEIALKVVESMPNWIPGKQRGTPVNVQMTLPIKFELDK